ncbi:tetratricopeptide repeat protein [Methylophilaceae bacterium]|jgi:tetratricopeptide (TPR) repeat protein|nr:tetratricopeptide repeat protein [Methylophilaceae bacterium]|tara:strand:+ start:495 stop:2078 length:1584 start_codon:yes stop_codon:yes gene_type:complete
MSNLNNLQASEEQLAPVYKLYLDGHYKEALSALDNLNHDFPNDPILFIIGGDCYALLKQYDLAIVCYEEALKVSPENISIYKKKIEVLGFQGKVEEASDFCQEAIKVAPNDSDLYIFRGDIFHKLVQFDKAVDSYSKAIKLNPNSAVAFCNKSNSLIELQRYEEAVASAKKAIQIKYDYSLAFFNLGVAAMNQRLFDLSMQNFNKAIDLEPNSAKYKFAKSTLLLLYGDFKNGWTLWESRWELDELFSPKLETNRPVWTGNKNVRLLVWPEQGIGDHILYSSLLSDLSKKCLDLIVILDERLVDLFRRSMGDFCTFYPDNNKKIELDYDEHISIGSLCQYLRTNEKDFESSRYGYLKDDQDKTDNIKKDLLALTPLNKKLCGISWGSTSKKTGTHKTIPLKTFIQMLDLKGYTYVSLQYGDTADEIKLVQDELGVDIISYNKVDNFNDMDGLASLIQACDTIISVDNITCQLAGALGKEIHVLLTYGSWWGWTANRIDNPWYDSVKIYKKGVDEPWLSLFDKLKANL